MHQENLRGLSNDGLEGKENLRGLSNDGLEGKFRSPTKIGVYLGVLLEMIFLVTILKK
jgi:hypothetical protein